MLNLYVNRVFPGDDFRPLVYSGAMILHTKLRSTVEFCGYAQQCIRQVFGDRLDARVVHTELAVEQFVEKVSTLKGEFTNSTASKEHIRNFLEEINQDPEEYFFDVPRIRVVPDYDYLHAGVSYAYLPHRDTWYGAPQCQINTWMPVFPIDPDQTMMINPTYFDRPVQNDSGDWDLQHWVTNERPAATQNINNEDRRHPVPLEEVGTDTELRLAGGTGDMIVFSGSHLHGTVPNRTGRVRYSIDFRVFHREDLNERAGAANQDGAARNIEFGLRDLLRASDFTPYLEAVQ
ncbi:phytanoyl-CoA dioxygenase family protein [Mycobacterium sp. MUNTM1]